MPLTITARVRDLFSMKWLRAPISDHDAGRTLALKNIESRRREALTLREKQDATNRQLRDELAAGLVCGRPAR